MNNQTQFYSSNGKFYLFNQAHWVKLFHIFINKILNESFNVFWVSDVIFYIFRKLNDKFFSYIIQWNFIDFALQIFN